jgi:diguanylate cyclase (GGDEF)-like protein
MMPSDTHHGERRHGQPLWRRRQIVLTERMAVVAAAATVPYEVYYAASDLSACLPVFVANLVFVSVCVAAVWLNRTRRYDLALDLMVTALYVHLFVVTAFIGTGPGVHLFYFALGGSLGMFFISGRESQALALTLLAAALFVVCEVAFPPGSTSVQLPHAVARVMYAVNAAAAVLVAGGLANRRALDAVLAREWSRLSHAPDSVAILMCDVDHFKGFNDRYGHVAGDSCLQRVAGALASVVQRSSDLIARYGGEEFLIVLVGADRAYVESVAGRLHAAVGELRLPHEDSDVALVVTISVGAVLVSDATLPEPDELIRRADAALYDANRAGRHRTCYDTHSSGRTSHGE